MDGAGDRLPLDMPDDRFRDFQIVFHGNWIGEDASYGGATQAVIEETTISHAYKKRVREHKSYRIRLRKYQV